MDSEFNSPKPALKMRLKAFAVSALVDARAEARLGYALLDVPPPETEAEASARAMIQAQDARSSARRVDATS